MFSYKKVNFIIWTLAMKMAFVISRDATGAATIYCILFHQFPYQVKSPVTKNKKIPVWIRQWAFNLDEVENCFLQPSNMH